MLALGIDIGTSGVRSAVLDEAGAVRSAASEPHAVQDVNRIDAEAWWITVKACVRSQVAALIADGLDPHEIAAAAIDGTSGSMVLVDAEVRPVTRALMYNSSGFVDEAAAIADHAPPGHIMRGSNSALARLMRLQAEDANGAATMLCHQADFVMAKLTGTLGLSDHNNALKTGFDPAAEAWPDWFADAGVRTALLPEAHPTGTPLATLDPAFAAELGLSAELMLHAGTTDSIAAFLATGASDLDTAVTSLGTTLALKILSPTRIDDPAIGLYSHRIGDMWLAGGASNTGGGVLLDHFTPAELAALSERIDPNEESGLDYYPLSRPGERFPVNDPDLAPRMTPRPADDAAFLHGLLEGIARVEARGYDALEERGARRPKRVLSVGGGAKNETWRQIRARVLGVMIDRAAHDEASIGAARLCLMSAAKEGLFARSAKAEN